MTFEVQRQGERHAGRAPGIDRRHLARLRRGELEVECELDLHGLTAREARAEVRHTLLACFDEGVRCVLVVHGRGRRSEQGAVLKEALPGWLEASPLGGLVMAFASALPEHGGAGATYVLLRRRRPGAGPPVADR